jgi:hypothetical protein
MLATSFVGRRCPSIWFSIDLFFFEYFAAPDTHMSWYTNSIIWVRNFWWYFVCEPKLYPFLIILNVSFSFWGIIILILITVIHFYLFRFDTSLGSSSCGLLRQTFAWILWVTQLKLMDLCQFDSLRLDRSFLVKILWYWIECIIINHFLIFCGKLLIINTFIKIIHFYTFSRYINTGSLHLDILRFLMMLLCVSIVGASRTESELNFVTIRSSLHDQITIRIWNFYIKKWWYFCNL